MIPVAPLRHKTNLPREWSRLSTTAYNDHLIWGSVCKWFLLDSYRRSFTAQKACKTVPSLSSGQIVMIVHELAFSSDCAHGARDIARMIYYAAIFRRIPLVSGLTNVRKRGEDCYCNPDWLDTLSCHNLRRALHGVYRNDISFVLSHRICRMHDSSETRSRQLYQDNCIAPGTR